MLIRGWDKAFLTASSCTVGGMTGDVGGALEAIVVLSYHDGTSHWGLWETALRDIRCSLEKPAFWRAFRIVSKGYEQDLIFSNMPTRYTIGKAANTGSNLNLQGV